MKRLTQLRVLTAGTDLATPFGVIEADPHLELERLQEQHEAAEQRSRRERQVSRATRRFISEQPKRLLTLDRLIPPGAPLEPITSQFPVDLPREWTSRLATRYDVRRA